MKKDYSNIVIHEYANVSLGKAWEVTQRDLPKLKEAIITLRTMLKKQFQERL